MALSTLVWKLASPYDAYVSHVVRLNNAIDRIRYFSQRALGHEAGLQSSVRFVPGTQDAALRAQRFREQLGSAAETMSDDDFEMFLAHLGGGATANVEADRAKAVSRMSHDERGIDEFFAIAVQELGILERRGYSTGRPDVARQLRENRLPLTGVSEYRRLLHELGLKVGKKAS
jgi:hypothetical protein